MLRSAGKEWTPCPCIPVSKYCMCHGTLSNALESNYTFRDTHFIVNLSLTVNAKTKTLALAWIFQLTIIKIHIKAGEQDLLSKSLSHQILN